MSDADSATIGGSIVSDIVTALGDMVTGLASALVNGFQSLFWTGTALTPLASALLAFAGIGIAISLFYMALSFFRSKVRKSV
mgnify:CR=1 FL=1